MVEPSDQVPETGKPNRLLVIAGIAALVLLVLCALAAVGGSYYLRAHPYFGPTSQAILVPDRSLVGRASRADVEKDAQILAARSKTLGFNVMFSVDEKDRIVAVGPLSVLTRERLAEMIAVGLLELADFGNEPVTEGTMAATDFGYSYFPPVQGPQRHTLLTNDDFSSVHVQPGTLAGQYRIAFVLTPRGKQVFADYSASHVGQYLCILMDRKVLSCPIIKNAITDGQGVIEGGFTLEQAQSLTAYLRVQGPLPLPLTVVQFVQAAK